MKKQAYNGESKEKPQVFVHPLAFHLYTDGSHRPVGNAAGAYLIFSERSKHIVKMSRFASRGSTINQMELMAINKALDHPKMDHVIIYTDSAYSISCLTLWRKSWARNNWMTPLNEPVKNKELIQEIGRKIDSKKFVRFVKIKAHSGDPFNSIVDFMAQGLTLQMVTDQNLPDGEYAV